MIFTFGKSDFLDLVNFDFLKLAKLVMINRFLILLLALPLLALVILLDILSFFLFSVIRVLKVSLSTIWSIKVGDVVILQKFLINLL